MDTFVELKSKSDYFQEYLYQSYEYKNGPQNPEKKWSLRRGSICRKIFTDHPLKGGNHRGGIHSEYP